MSAPGALLFGRYAFAPNRLGYCGPDDSKALFDYVSQHTFDKGLLELERRFAGAYPYLKLIAQANAIADPFDERVVDAYWIGNRYLNTVTAAPFADSLADRFKKRMDPHTFAGLTTKLEAGAKPHHNFHVFDVYSRAGLMHDNHADIVVETMDSCRISWGKVVTVDGAELVVARRALELRAGKLALSEPRLCRVTSQIDGLGFADHAQPGEYVSIHWQWACDVLTPTALRRLVGANRDYMALANTTL